MSVFRIALGAKIKDSITGFSGVVTGRAEYITGCRQYLVTAKGTKGKRGEHEWFDEDRLMGKAAKPQNPGGPQAYPAPSK